MKLYLDDERKTPVGWVRVFWPEEAIAWLKTEMVTEISLDHDLGDDDWLITSCRSANNIMPITIFLPAGTASFFYSA
ncbi:cyclic-phosphate processing receiver domain-containing protein [Aeromonas caviae]|uniref:cyclic-phosphate processing receiver domain-containing protein n=1 Tax=Aeromonas caviae TaxID=648 RepID=UPI0038D06574